MITIDKLIEVLQEAKEHGFDGKDAVYVNRESRPNPKLVGKMYDAYYDRDKFYIEYGTL